MDPDQDRFFDPESRAADKQRSRGFDDARLASARKKGAAELEKVREQMRLENGGGIGPAARKSVIRRVGSMRIAGVGRQEGGVPEDG